MLLSTLSELVADEPQYTASDEEWKFLVSLAQLCRWRAVTSDSIHPGKVTLLVGVHSGAEITLLRTQESNLYVLHFLLHGFVTTTGAERVIVEANDAHS